MDNRSSGRKWPDPPVTRRPDLRPAVRLEALQQFRPVDVLLVHHDDPLSSLPTHAKQYVRWTPRDVDFFAQLLSLVASPFGLPSATMTAKERRSTIRSIIRFDH